MRPLPCLAVFCLLAAISNAQPMRGRGGFGSHRPRSDPSGLGRGLSPAVHHRPRPRARRAPTTDDPPYIVSNWRDLREGTDEMPPCKENPVTLYHTISLDGGTREEERLIRVNFNNAPAQVRNLVLPSRKTLLMVLNDFYTCETLLKGGEVWETKKRGIQGCETFGDGRPNRLTGSSYIYQFKKPAFTQGSTLFNYVPPPDECWNSGLSFKFFELVGQDLEPICMVTLEPNGTRRGKPALGWSGRIKNSKTLREMARTEPLQKRETSSSGRC